jgi:hypothetical protein
MANPQKENGHVRIANEVLDKLLIFPWPSSTPLEICLFVIRKTWGFNKKTDRISLTQFQKGIDRSRPTVVHWINWLVKSLLLVKGGQPPLYEYGLNKDYSQWVVKGVQLVKARHFTSKPPLTKTGKPPLTHNNTIDNIQKTIYTEDFEKFWKEYPNKKAKPIAFKSWAKLSLKERDDLMQVLPAHKRSDFWLRDEGRFIPHPATWINQRRWEDELKLENNNFLPILK